MAPLLSNLKHKSISPLLPRFVTHPLRSSTLFLFSVTSPLRGDICQADFWRGFRRPTQKMWTGARLSAVGCHADSCLWLRCLLGRELFNRFSDSPDVVLLLCILCLGGTLPVRSALRSMCAASWLVRNARTCPSSASRPQPACLMFLSWLRSRRQGHALKGTGLAVAVCQRTHWAWSILPSCLAVNPFDTRTVGCLDWLWNWVPFNLIT